MDGSKLASAAGRRLLGSDSLSTIKTGLGVGNGGNINTPGTPIPIKPLVPGNIDLSTRPIIHNSDGTVSTIRSISVTDDNGNSILIPTAVNGKIVSNDEAIKHFQNTGEHLGVFKNDAVANIYAILLHNQEANRIGM